MPSIKSEGRRYWQSSKKYTPHSKNNMAFYNKKSWRNLRASYINDNPLCEMCFSKGILKEGYYVDHNKRINDGGKTYDKKNLQTLCIPCDAKKRQSEGREVIAHGGH